MATVSPTGIYYRAAGEAQAETVITILYNGSGYVSLSAEL